MGFQASMEVGFEKFLEEEEMNKSGKDKMVLRNLLLVLT